MLAVLVMLLVFCITLSASAAETTIEMVVPESYNTQTVPLSPQEITPPGAGDVANVSTWLLLGGVGLLVAVGNALLITLPHENRTEKVRLKRR